MNRQGSRLMSDSQLPLRFDMQVPPDGRIEVQLPLSAGSQVTMYVVEKSDADSTICLPRR